MDKIILGELIKEKLTEQEIDFNQFSYRLGMSRLKLGNMLNKNQIEVDLLLKISIILKYDFFRHFSFFLMLHHAISTTNSKKPKNSFLTIRKNIYTHEIKEFIVSQIVIDKITPKKAIEKYGIPRTTLYKWLKQIKIKKSDES